MDRKVVLESKTELADGRVRLMFASDTRHAQAAYIIERKVPKDDFLALLPLGESIRIEAIVD